ncbi:MAG TPA: carbon monoxide dehydrogenase subunit G [Afipia sp.]
MAMTMAGEIELAAPRKTVWAKLNDPETLKSCIPGCEVLNPISDHEFEAVAVNKIGPVKAKFKAKVVLSDIVELEGYRIEGNGDGGMAGFAKGAASIHLADRGENTVLSYNVETQIGGKLAQLGQRLIDGVAKKLADEFFSRFAAAVKEH